MIPTFRALLTLVIAGFAAEVGAGDWPQWRGPNRDGHAAADETLPDAFRETTPSWTRPLGGGFSGIIVANGQLFVTDEEDGNEVAHALDPATGRDLWQTPYARAFGDEWGRGPRCTPLANEGLLYLQSARGEFVCLRQKDGTRVWGTHFEADYGVRFLGGGDSSDAASRRRGHNGSAVILDDHIYVPVGSAQGATVVAFDKRTGREIWRAGKDETAYAGLMVAASGHEPHVVGFTAGALGAWNARDGSTVWSMPLRTAANRHAVTPILISNRVIVSSHTLGMRAYDYRRAARGWDVHQAWALPEMKTSLATAVLVDGFLYGQGPDQDFVCVEAASGRVAWRRPGFGERPLVGYSSVIAADDRLLVLTDGGEAILLPADPTQYRELSRLQVCGKTWSHPALAEGRLYVRDRRQLAAWLVARESTPR